MTSSVVGVDVFVPASEGVEVVVVISPALPVVVAVMVVVMVVVAVGILVGVVDSSTACSLSLSELSPLPLLPPVVVAPAAVVGVVVGVVAAMSSPTHPVAGVTYPRKYASRTIPLHAAQITSRLFLGS